MKYTKNSGHYSLPSKTLCKKIFASFGLSECNVVSNPLSISVDLSKRHKNEAELSPTDNHKFRLSIGCLAYLPPCTHHTLTFSNSTLAKFLHNPSVRRLNLAKWICKWIARTIDYSFGFKIDIAVIQSSIPAAVDADWVKCKTTHRSTTEFIFAINSTKVYWKSKRKTIFSLTSG